MFANSWWFSNFYSPLKRAVTLAITEVTKPWLHRVFGRVYGITQFYHHHFLGPTRMALWDNKCIYSLTLVQEPCCSMMQQKFHTTFDFVRLWTMMLHVWIGRFPITIQSAKDAMIGKTQKFSCPALSSSSPELQDELNCYLPSGAKKPPCLLVALWPTRIDIHQLWGKDCMQQGNIVEHCVNCRAKE